MWFISEQLVSRHSRTQIKYTDHPSHAPCNRLPQVLPFSILKPIHLGTCDHRGNFFFFLNQRNCYKNLVYIPKFQQKAQYKDCTYNHSPELHSRKSHHLERTNSSILSRLQGDRNQSTIFHL